MSKFTFIVIVLGYGFLAACIPETSSQEPIENDAGVYFPQLQPMGEMPLALMYGQLINEGGCLRVVANEWVESYLVLWPVEVEVIVLGDAIAIQGASGEILAWVEQQIGLVGGEYAQPEWVSELLQPGCGFPDDCPGPYWLIGEIIEPEG